MSDVEVMINMVSELECLVNIDYCSDEITTLVTDLKGMLYELRKTC